jgi:hypothetical protein
MSSSEKNRLLNETLREDREYEVFRAILFEAGLADFRKKQGMPMFWKPWALAASVAFGIGLAIWATNRNSGSPQVTATEGLVDSFVSRPLSTAELVRSKPDPRLLVHTPKNDINLEIVKTEQVPLIELNNQDLLATFGNRPAGFVEHDGHLEFMVLGN